MSNAAALLSLLNYALWLAVAYGLSYILLAFGLTMLGARVGQRSTWLAWLPVLNFYLLCRLARSPRLLIFPLLVPLLNLVVFAYLGARIAQRFNRPAALGAGFGVPVLGNVVPLVLALGQRTDEEQAAPAPAQPPFVTALIHAGVVCTLLVLPVAGWLAAKHFSSPPPPPPSVQQAAAALPARVAGTMTEFPLDSATTNKATPSALQVATFDRPQPGDKPRVGMSQDQLPPWIKAETITTVAESATTADFNSATTVAPVKVVNLALRPEAAGELKAPTAAELSAISPTATAKGVEVKAADNTTYRGYRVDSAGSVYYALRRADTNSVVLISAPDSAGAPVAERLAANLGNGQGLMDDDLGRGAIARVPQAPPGTRLTRLETATIAEIDAVLARMNDPKITAQIDDFHGAGTLEQRDAIANRAKDPKRAAQAEAELKLMDDMSHSFVKSLLPLGKAMMPRAYTVGFFSKTEAHKEEYGGAVAGFPSSADAWTALEAARTAANICQKFGFSSIHTGSIELGGYRGITIESAEPGQEGLSYSSFILLREGTYLRLFFSSQENTKITLDELRPWVEGQLARR